MNLKHEKSKLKFESKLSEEFIGMKSMDTNFVIHKLEESLKLREMPMEKRIKRSLNPKV